MLASGVPVILVTIGDNTIVTRDQRLDSVATTALRKKDTEIEYAVKKEIHAPLVLFQSQGCILTFGSFSKNVS